MSVSAAVKTLLASHAEKVAAYQSLRDDWGKVEVKDNPDNPKSKIGTGTRAGIRGKMNDLYPSIIEVECDLTLEGVEFVHCPEFKTTTAAKVVVEIATPDAIARVQKLDALMTNPDNARYGSVMDKWDRERTRLLDSLATRADAQEFISARAAAVAADATEDTDK